MSQGHAEAAHAKEVSCKLEGGLIRISGALTKSTAALLYDRFRTQGPPADVSAIDVNALSKLDTSGVAFLEWLQEAASGELRIHYEECPTEISKLLDEFLSPREEGGAPESPRIGYFEGLGQSVFTSASAAGEFLVLMAEIFYWSVVGIFNTAQRRKASILEQCWKIGVQSLPLIALLSIILGVILAMQSAIQLRTFGANIYVANLMAISMVNEMGPMMSAILIAGRSGSSIASEIATMKVSEEVEALQVMGIDPIRYVVVPKFLAITMTIPLLVAFSIYLGIGGGMMVGAASLDIAPEIFISRAADSVGLIAVMKSLTKSVFFGWVIVVISSYFGFSVSGGAEEVGRATTLAVVYSILTVIVLDALFSLTSLV